ncbi:MAG: class I SAM-dependent methyltransferase [Chloroflexi bacterium]|nr:class I SAM-dependent methyltransferase [Chloroflexota bacterium]
MAENAGTEASGSDFSFKWFAEQPFYRAVNAQLLDLASLQPGQRILEVACGTGAVTRMILDKLRGARDSLVIGLDMSGAALKEAMEQLGTARGAAVQFVQGRAEQLSQLVKERVDTVVFCNGIHYIPDKASLLDQVSQALKPGGVFAFNTSFFQGVYPPETERFYRRWMFRAIRLLRANYGLMPEGNKVEARHHLSPDQYCSLLHDHGFEVRTREVRIVDVPLGGWLDISRFEDFVQGAMPGVPLDKASRSLQDAVVQTFQELGLTAVPRNWLSVVAVKV